MENAPCKFSIIIPVYNVEPYLRRCVDSVLSQSFNDYEVILVDDGSPDRCGEICDEYARNNKSVKCIHRENGGISVARNTGLNAATGEYVIFIDSDDMWSDPDALKMINDVFCKNPKTRCFASVTGCFRVTERLEKSVFLKVSQTTAATNTAF